MSRKYKLHRTGSSIDDDAWLNLGDLNGLDIINPMLDIDQEYIDNPGLLELKIMRDPNFLGFAAKILLDIDLMPFQCAILQELWIRPFPMLIMSRGGGKSFLLAVYATLKCILVPGTKIVGVGAAFRQSKVIFEYMEKIWTNAPVLRSVCNSSSGPYKNMDRCIMQINDSVATFIPIGDGSKIRGLRADTIIADEFASISPSIYETVIRGFAAVSAKPLDGVKAYARKQSMKKRGVWNKEEEKVFQSIKSNQCVITGTADYDFMHYADYWKKYMVFIRSEGKLDKQVQLPSGETKTLRDYFPDGIEEGFDYRDYSVMRIPYSLIPKGYMDDKVVAAAKSNTHKAIYDKEYGAVFPSDSDGFFRRSLIESCVTSKENPIKLSSGQGVWFDAMLTGVPNMEYVYGIDPAAENDNLTIVILEMHADHTRIVYGWSTNIRDFQKRKKAGMVEDHDYYGFCARKVRNLMKVFPTSNIAMDAQGGGRAILEAFHDPDRLQDGEHFLWPTNKVLSPDKELPTDIEAGLHIIHMCQFANTDFTYMANHGTKKDFESKTLLFPRFDPVTLEISAHKDEETAQKLGVRSLYDTLEDCVMEIEDLKDELCTIVMTRTSQSSQARDRWDTPETTNSEGKKGRMRKDRYSALIMANFIARSIQRAPADIGYGVIGGLAHQIAAKKNLENRKRNDLYSGPDWYTSGMNKNCIAVVKKGV